MVYTIQVPAGVMELGSEGSAAGGRWSDPSEWQRSKFHERIASRKFLAPQQEDGTVYHFLLKSKSTGNQASSITYMPV